MRCGSTDGQRRAGVLCARGVLAEKSAMFANPDSTVHPGLNICSFTAGDY
jgi:hypothetical protein